MAALSRNHNKCKYCGTIKDRRMKRCWGCRLKKIGGPWKSETL